MKVILLEKIRNLGELGARVSVKPGYARNYLIPKAKAVLATAENLLAFEDKRSELEKAAVERLDASRLRAEQLGALRVIIRSRVADEGKLYGSVTANDVVRAIQASGLEASKSEVDMPQGPIRQVGEYSIKMCLHTDVEAIMTLVVEAEA